MSKEVDFYFDIGSPASYLAWMKMPKLIEQTGAKVNYLPMYISGVFKLSGNDTPITVPAKGKWLFKDLKRWAKQDDIPFVVNSQFPMNSISVMRALAAYAEDPRLEKLATEFYKAMWDTDENLTNPQNFAEIAKRAGIDSSEMAEKIASPETKQCLIDLTQTAADRGVFGAPTFFIGDDMHFGQDRMDFLKEDLLN